MNTKSFVEAIDAEISRLEEIKRTVIGNAAPQKKGTAPANGRQRTMSAEGRARVAAAQRKRWAAHRKGQGTKKAKG